VNKVIINGKITKGYFHDKEENGIIFMITLDKDGYEFPTKVAPNQIENIGKYIGKKVLIEGQLRRYEGQTLVLAEKFETE
jgi:hypothetical protein